jgi:hypothetical protein
MKPAYATPLFTTVFTHEEHHQLAALRLSAIIQGPGTDTNTVSEI